MKFKTKGSLLRAKSLEELWEEKGIGYIPSNYFIIKKDGLYIHQNAAVYKNSDLGSEVSGIITLSYEDNCFVIDITAVSHSVVYSSESVDMSNYYGPFIVDLEMWSKEKAVARKNFDFISQYLADLLDKKIDLVNGEKAEIDQEISFLKPYWVKAFERDFLSLCIVNIVYNYFDAVDRSAKSEPSVIDLYVEFSEETKQIIELSLNHIRANLNKEFQELLSDEKEELLETLKKEEAFEFLSLIGNLA